jgi:hypothetical protein
MSDQGAGSEPVEKAASADAELHRLEAERDALAQEVDELRHRPPRRRRLRRIAVVVLVGLTSLLIVLSTTVVWVHRTLLNTDVFVSTVAPALKEPGVDSAIATRSTDQLFAALEVQKRIKEALPSKIGIVAGPVSNATEHAVTGQLTKVLDSGTFYQLWTNILRTTHGQLTAVLRGQHSQLLSNSNGYIVLNTVPVINQALGRVSGLASSLTGHHVTLPTITSAQPPQQAIDKLSKALGVQLPHNYGQITLVKAKNLSQLQRLVKAFDRLSILLPLLTAALIALTLWLSVARRRTLLQLVVTTSLLVVVVRRVLIHEQGALSQSAHNPQVAHDVMGDLLSGMYNGTQWLLWAALVIAVIALVTGPYHWAVVVRSWVRRGWDALVALFTPSRRAVAARWIGVHGSLLQAAVAVIAFVLLLVVSVSWVSFLVIAVLLAAAELYLNWMKGRIDDGSATEPGPPPPSVPSSPRPPATTSTGG